MSLKCQNCGYNKFKKTGVRSCSAIPPFFKCARCDKFVQVPTSYEDGNLLVNKGFVNKNDEWFLHMECYEYGTTESGEWHTEEYIVYDPVGDEMYRRKALCDKCYRRMNG